MLKNIKKHKNIIIKILFIFLIVLFVLPSIIYLIKNQTVLNFGQRYFTYFLNESKTMPDNIKNTICYFSLFLAISIVYVIMLKNSQKLFSNIKKIFVFILIVSVLFLIMLPIISSDIYYYVGTGWLESNYEQNPYYTSIDDIAKTQEVQDSMFSLAHKPWTKLTVVYGPTWSIISNILSSASLGNITVALFIFKIASLIIHIINCLLIYKISNKKFFVILYGLNPYILFEFLGNVHNDIYVVFFILISLYFLLKKRNILLCVILLAIGASIKYFTIFLLPFVIFYYYKDEKLLKKILYCVLYGIIFLLTFILPYLIYFRDFEIFKSIFIQQTKIRQSLSFITYLAVGQNNILKVTRVFFAIFFVFVATICIKTLVKPKYTFKELIGKYNCILTVFIFLIITNLCNWYIIWLFPTIMWQKFKNIKLILSASIATELAYSIYFYNHLESYRFGLIFIGIEIACTIIFTIIFSRRKKLNEKTNIN